MNIKERNSNFEILRVVCMFLIIFHHYFVHGLSETNISNANLVVFGTLGAFGNVSVLVFVLIGGFFMSESKFKMSKFLKLLFEYVFYSLTIYIVVYLVKNIYISGESLDFKEFFNAKELLKIIFPFYGTGSPNWFISTYLVLYLLTPFLNFLIKSMSKKIYIGFLTLTITIWFFIPMVTVASFGGNELITLIIIYFIGAYLKKFPPKFMTKKTSIISLSISIPAYMLLTVALFLLPKVVESLSFLSQLSNSVRSINSVISLVVALSIFSVVLNAKPHYSKVINFIGGSVLAVYLIHDNLYFKNFMWEQIFRVQNYSTNNLLILNMLWVSAAIFASCIVIDIIRRYLLEVPLFILLKKPIAFLDNFFLKLYSEDPPNL